MEIVQLNREAWERAWAELPADRREVYLHPAYADICAAWEGGRAGCWSANAEGRGRMLYPYLAHPLDAGQCDVQTPYGYGGPIFTGAWNSADRAAALAKTADAFASIGSVAEFVRCHPEWVDAESLATAGFRTFQVRTNVECDLSEEDFTTSWSSGARRNLRKARTTGLRYRTGDGEADGRAFEHLYDQTARRLDMAASYRFDAAYFRELLQLTGARLVIVEADDVPGATLAAAMIFVGGRLAHYHLGASDFVYQDRRPNDFLYYAMADTARRAGCERIVWGGGMSNDPADTLFRFKTHFGAVHRPVYCAGRVLNAHEYKSLCDAWQERHPGQTSNLFLKYRG